MNLYRSLSRVFSILTALTLFFAIPGVPSSAAPTDPWTTGQTISPADFAKELQRKDPSLKIIYVGVRTLYEGAHIPGAMFRGPGSKEEGIADLKKFAATLPKDSKVVIYCGCCPLDRCPNLRPAFSALRDMGFTHLRVLILPISFASDWVEKGYPIQRGS
jgi:hypothetical protein